MGGARIGKRPQKIDRVVHGRFKQVGNTPGNFRTVQPGGNCNLEDVRTITTAIAIGTADENIAEKLHFDLFEACAPAFFALALARVEAKGATVQSPLERQFRFGKKV